MCPHESAKLQRGHEVSFIRGDAADEALLLKTWSESDALDAPLRVRIAHASELLRFVRLLSKAFSSIPGKVQGIKKI